MRSVDKAFDKMDKDIRKREKLNKKKKNKDVWAALASLASVMLIALAMAWLKSGESVARQIVGEDVEKIKTVYETTRNVLFGAGFFSVFAVVIYIIKKIKYREKPNVEEAFIDYDRLDAARARVERARAERQSMSVDKNDDRYMDTYSGEVSRSNKPEGMTREEYNRMRQQEYERYLSMEFDEDEIPKSRGYGIDEENPDLIEELTPIERLKDYITEHKLVIGIGASLVVVAAAIVILLMVL